jgi:uncharacterized membrane protein YtjA (UPF0391 family)
MTYYAILFLIIAIVAGIYGFGGIDAAQPAAARVLFFVFALAFLVTAAVAANRRERTV